MIRSEGTVVAMDADTGEVWVEIPERAAACGNCSSAGGCHSGLLGLGGGARRYKLANRIDASVGDRVSLVVADGTVMRASWLSYLLPAILAIAGAALGQLLAEDIGALAGTLVGLVGGFVYLRRSEGRLRQSHAVIGIERPHAASCHLSEVI